MEGTIIKEIGKIEFFVGGQIMVNETIPVKELREFTGLLDSKGKEIYEHDLVKFGEEGTIGLVEWGQLSDCCVEGEGWTIKDVDWQNGLNFWKNDNLLEVVGNIYESDLLEK